MQANLHFSAGPSKNGVVLGRQEGCVVVVVGGYGETPLNCIKPTEIFSHMEVGLTVAAKRTTSTQSWDVGEDGITTARPLVRRGKRQLNLVLGGGGPGDESCMHGRKYFFWKTGLDKCDNKIRTTKVCDVVIKAALRNEGLLYSCHGDEQVSQASSFLWLLPWTLG